MSRRRLLPFAAVLAASLAAPAVVTADDVADAKAVLAEIEAAEKAKDEGALANAAKKVSPVYRRLSDGAVKMSLAKALAGIVKNAKLEDRTRRAALAGIVETEDSSIGWKVLQSCYPANDVEDETKFNVEVVKAVGLLHPDGAIDPLLETFKKAKQPDLAAEAVTALGKYRKSKRRESILEEVVKAGKNMVPARSTRANPSQETMARWSAVALPIGKALDELTGDAVGDPLEWFKRVDAAKKNYKSLFKD